MEDFTKVRAWQSGKEFFVDVYETTKSFPPEERYGFQSQMRRAARSICGNIAEGCGYRGDQDSARFYRMGFGSSSECYSDLHLARTVDLISAKDFERLESKLLPTRKQLFRLIEAIDKRTGRRY
jgi:four helix bundle protein